jgi:hypothetical protein
MLPQPVSMVSNGVAKKALDLFGRREKKFGRAKTVQDILLNMDDVLFLLVQWRRRCVVSGTVGCQDEII